ncbi:TIGR03118 family protein [Paraburkholderia terrae]|uniref:TIGR03118 family protein n=1 Tax=Paraburkholderia terrae TaxID=311230 RepID=UPI00296B584D|nr:TIGR03118 family protein [Paraburkholderia terrae]
MPSFKSTILGSDGSVAAPHVAPNLQNSWGIAFGPTTPVWVSDNNTQKSSLYDGNDVVQSLVVTTTGRKRSTRESDRHRFQQHHGLRRHSEWRNRQRGIHFCHPRRHDRGAGAAEYTGLAIASNAGTSMLYVADFHNGKVDMFDKTFMKISAVGAFSDPTVPAGFNLFGIQAVGTTIYVAYAKLGPDGHRDQSGAGNGVVDAFDTAGHLIRRIATTAPLNSPWGIAMALANFGAFSNDLLIGNFGDGTINAFDPATGESKGPLTQADGSEVTQPGLWSLAFGNNADNQPSNTLFFAAGPTATTSVYGRIHSSM